MKKQLFISFLLLVLLSMTGIKAYAHDFAVANAHGQTIYYVYNNGSTGTTVSVSYRGSSSTSYSNEYSGNIYISDYVAYNGKTYCVTSIGEYAFFGCTGLTSITIPNSVKSIGTSAFESCTKLSSITIPNSVTSIGITSFAGCNSLMWVTIPKSVTSIGKGAFSYCNSLNSINVESGNTKYDSRDNCNAIIETTSKTLIGGCKTTTIPNSVTNIGEWAFGFINLTSITIPISVTSIGEWAFGFINLTSITIPISVTSIGDFAFNGCSTLTSVIVNRAEPLSIPSNTFNECYNATLYVPVGSKAKYQAADYWKNFKEIVEKEKCGNPTIKYIGGMLKFECETEGVHFVYKITTPSSRNQTGNYVEMPHTNIVSVYAKKDGCLDSDVVTTYFDIRGIQGDVNQDGKVTITDAVSVVNLILTPPVKHWIYGEDPISDPPFRPGAWDSAAMRFSSTMGAHLPTIPDDVYFGLKTLIFDVSDVSDDFDLKVMNGWWSNTYYDHVKWEPGLNKLQITEKMAQECAQGGEGKDLDLMLYSGTCTINAVYYEESATP